MALAMGLFEGISFYIAEKLVKDASQLKSVLVSGGGQREFYPSELVSHVIADSLPPSSLGLSRCEGSLMLHSDWVYMSSRCGVLLPTAPFTLCGEKLFSNLVFSPSKLPRSDVEKLACLVFYYGGCLQQRLDSTVTHLITSDITGAKYECALRHVVKVVTPSWVVDSINMGRLADEGEYGPAGRGFDDHTQQGGLPKETDVQCNGDTTGDYSQAKRSEEMVPLTLPIPSQDKTKEPLSLPVTPTSEAMEDGEQVFTTTTDGAVPLETCKNATQEDSIGVDERYRSGVCAQEMEEGQRERLVGEGEEGQRERLVGEEEEGDESGEGELQVVIALKEGATPTDDITPVPATNSVISAGNGVTESGLTTTSHVNPRLGTEGHSTSRLLAGLVFHLTGYLECMEEDTLTKWKEVIVQHGGRVVDSYDADQCTHLLALHKKSDTFAKAYADEKCISSAHWLNDVLTEGRMFPPRCALHFPTAFKWQIPGADKHTMTLTNYTGVERELVKDMIHLTGISYTGHLSRDTSYLICKSASGKKYEKAVEWGVTVINASFLADIIHYGQIPAVLYARHTQLGQPHEFLPSHSCFEANRLLGPWENFLQHYSEQNGECMDQETSELVFRSVKRRDRQDRGEEECVAKRRKVDVQRESCPVVMLTGISQSIAKKLKTTILRLGGRITDRPADCTHLVAPRVVRTVKFLSGISVCRYVVTPEWVEQCEREEKLVNEEGFTLRDADAEETFSMDIPTVLSRAQAGKLLKGFCVHATANVQPIPDSLREIIECAGGQLLSFSELQSSFGMNFEKLSSAGVRLLVLSTPEDLAAGLCLPFTSHSISIYNAELVLTGALKQKLDLSQNILSLTGSISGTVNTHST